MKSVVSVLCFMLLCLGLITPVIAQISITDSDIISNVLNGRRTTYENGDTLTVNLGISSSVAQTWDFSGLSWGNPMHRDTSHRDIVAPSGVIRAEEFPSANAASVFKQISMSGEYTITFTVAEFVEVSPTALRFLGGVMRQQVTPDPPPPFIPDSIRVIHNIRKAFNLPLTFGYSETWTDTSLDLDGGYKIYTHIYEVNGFGTLTFPDGRTLPVLRASDDRAELRFNSLGEYEGRHRRRNIAFWAQDFTMLEFETDTTYTGGTVFSGGWSLQVKTASVGVKPEAGELPLSFNLLQNYPNPFNPTTSIFFSLPEDGYTTLKVYDVLGREVATLVDHKISAGNYEIPFNAGSLSSGLYFYRLTSGQFSMTRKMMMLK